MNAVSAWREEGLNVSYTIDAGPNVHCICIEEDADKVDERLRKLPGVIELLRASPGQSARII
jgi:diphosphomevalonate decarboxylase